MFQQTVDVLVLLLLVATGLIVLRMRTLIGAAMLMGFYSFLSAGWMLILDAPDVAFTEAAVGAGVSTIIILVTLSLTTVRVKRQPRRVTPILVVLITGAVLIYGTMDMPHFGDPDAKVHTHTGYEYIARTRREIGVPNIVTAVLGSYRGYDTLGETVVVFTAGMGVLLLLRRPKDEEEDQGAEAEDGA